jgi:hypothetical protein
VRNMVGFAGVLCPAKCAWKYRRDRDTSAADQLVSSGEWRRGINGLITGAMASSKKENGRSVITVESIRPLDSDIAIVDGRYETMSDGAEAVRKMWTTLVVKKTSNGWKIAAIRNMLPSTPNPGR